MTQVSRIEVFEFTVPKETPESNPFIAPVEFDPGTVIKWTLAVPEGPAGLSGVQIRAFGTQLVPNTPGKWLVSNDEVITSEPANWPNSGRLELAGYNEGEYAHTYVLRLEVIENALPPKLASTPAEPLSTTPSGEIATTTSAETPPPTEGETTAPTVPAEPEPTAPTEPTEPTAPTETPATEPTAPAETPTVEAPVAAAPAPEAEIPTLEPPAAEPVPGVEPGEAAPGPPEVAEQEPQPLTSGNERSPAEAVSKHPKTKYKTVSREITTKPATGLIQVASAIPGHPEVHMGDAIAVNLILHYYPRLLITSTTGGTHAPDSLHYKGEATDLASSDVAYMNEAAKWAHDHLAKYLTEGIHNPDLSVANGQDVDPSHWGATTWAEHLNHLHIAVAPPQEEALIAANRPGKKKVKERVATNPAKRKGKGGGKGTKKSTKRKGGGKKAKRSTKRKAGEHKAKHKTTRRKAPKRKAKAKTAKRRRAKPKAKAKPKKRRAAPKRAAGGSRGGGGTRGGGGAHAAPKRQPAPRPRRRR